MNKILLGLIAILAIFALSGCGDYGDAESAGDTSSDGTTSLVLSAEGESSVGLTYTPLGDGAILVEVDCGDGDGDCSVDVDQNTLIGDEAVAQAEHYLGDGDTDPSTCPFALDNLEAAEIAEAEAA